MFKRLALGLLTALLLLAAVLVANAWRQGSRQVQVPALAPLAVDERAVADSLSVAIRARTVSDLKDPNLNADQFVALQSHIQQRYPKVHATLKREMVGGLSLLYTWPGRDATAPGVALMAHQDVVSISPGTESLWQAEPFAGTIRDGYVWGRGAWDDKSNLITQLEAVERLIANGFQPTRSIYLVFGADEEVGGERGALPIARLLKERGVKLDFVVDEGLLITEGVLPGLSRPAALVGLAEKGSVSVLLRAQAPGGHSSMPPPPGQSAIAQLAQAITQVDGHPMPAVLDTRSIAGQMFDAIAPEMPGAQRVVLSNLWLFRPLVQAQLEKGQSTNAMLRTTTAATIVQGGVKENVLPAVAEATVNFRIKPGDTQAAVLAHVRSVVANPAVQVSQLPGGFEPSQVASVESRGYQLVNRTLREVVPSALVAPGLMVGGTDSRHFAALSENILKFSPIRARPEDLPRFHGTNERISTAGLVEMVRFYHRLLQQAAGS
ncbi:acetylornithine deacetylase/succinyldiaminopimelate desuccinylase-like deacylase [Burkholderiales bacterium JOSHI_001]|nr:acetylornithine deacetylase/succinyldiaminopimelate desuccinylase-like deacylase [Burkholderiales bacterium JOSHI_001]